MPRPFPPPCMLRRVRPTCADISLLSLQAPTPMAFPINTPQVPVYGMVSRGSKGSPLLPEPL